MDFFLKQFKRFFNIEDFEEILKILLRTWAQRMHFWFCFKVLTLKWAVIHSLRRFCLESCDTWNLLWFDAWLNLLLILFHCLCLFKLRMEPRRIYPIFEFNLLVEQCHIYIRSRINHNFENHAIFLETCNDTIVFLFLLKTRAHPLLQKKKIIPIKIPFRYTDQNLTQLPSPKIKGNQINDHIHNKYLYI